LKAGHEFNTNVLGICVDFKPKRRRLEDGFIISIILYYNAPIPL